jgi:hypothetical protein
MNRQSTTVAFSLLLVLQACASPSAKKGYAPIDPETLMGRVMKLAAPGEPHKELARHAGNWAVTWKVRQGPQAPWEEASGESRIEMALGGRFLVEDTSAQFGGVPWQGRMLLGYDNLKKRYVSAWIDSFGTGIVTFEGTADAVGKVITLEGEIADPLTPQGRPVKVVTAMLDGDRMAMKLWDTGPDGEMYQSMEASYQRR